MARKKKGGWSNQTKRHSNAKKYGRAGGRYATPKKRFKSAKWSGKTDSGSQWAMLRKKGYSHQEAVDYIEKGKKPVRYIDSDGDGVPDNVDCEPNNPKRHYKISSISDKDELFAIRTDIQTELEKKGFRGTVSVDGNDIKLHKMMLEKGHNVRTDAFSGKDRRTKNLAWSDWVEVNKVVNDVLDKKHISANVKSLGNKFDIRDKKEGARTEKDWESLASENVGSIMYPISREDSIRKNK